MAGVKIINFLGTAPKVSPELLPNTAGQEANNCKLYSGDLIPYPQPVVVGNTGRTGTIKTLFALRDPVTGDPQWLSWTTDVDVVVATATDEIEQRFYYTGDGVPKVSNYELATGGPAPYPFDYYELGLPIPPDTSILTTSASTFTTKTTSTISRDSGSIVTVVTSSAHGLRTGNFVTVSGFTFLGGTYSQGGGQVVTVTINNHGLSSGASVTLDFTTGTAPDGTYTISVTGPNTFDITVPSSATTSGDVRLDIRGFNAANVECTVVNSTTFTYFSPGFQFATLAIADGKVDLGGLTQARSYVFTWITPWDEESIASKPSDNLYIKEGITVTVSGIPTAKPAGKNFIRGVRLYRTLASTSGTEYFRLATLWFPLTLASGFASRTGNVSRIETTFPHNLDEGDRFKISGASSSSFDITGGIVKAVIDDYTFTYDQVGATIGTTTLTSGTLYYDVSENPPTTAARYWGDGSYNFTDDFDSRDLLDILETDNYDPPPDNLKNLTAAQNNILIGSVGNELYFSEPGVPHAWPTEYALTLEYPIVAIAAISGSMLVLTTAYPYLVSGSDPANMSVARIDANYPCLSAKSVVTMGYGIVYSTHDGLALYSPSVGPQVVTKLLYNNDTWETDLDPTSVVAEYYGENYFASHSNGGFIFEQDQKIGGFFVTTDTKFTASWYDSVGGAVYFVTGTNGDIYRWDDLSQPAQTQTWKSKVIVTKDMINLGAARVVADYSQLTTLWELTDVRWETDTEIWNAVDGLTFRLWIDKELIYQTVLLDSGTFRLPTGYRTDTFEIGVEGNIRVRAVHMAETPFGLRTA